MRIVPIQLVPTLTVGSPSIQQVTNDADGTQVTRCQTLQQAVTERAQPMESEHQYANTPNNVTMSRYCENAVSTSPAMWHAMSKHDCLVTNAPRHSQLTTPTMNQIQPFSTF